MPRNRSPNREKAYEIFREHGGNIENRVIAGMLGEKEKTISNWKCRDQWNVVLQSKECSTTKERGAQPGNQNAVGHGGTGPPENKNAEKHGLFAKYLPDETMDIINSMSRSPLDILWDNIQISYAAIVRAQSIMYVKDKNDITTTQIQRKDGETVTEERWEVQQAWDKQANFLKAQARAQGELRSLIKQYDEMLHKDWELATEEQRTRIDAIRAKAQLDDGDAVADDGFLAALSNTAAKDWSDETEG